MKTDLLACRHIGVNKADAEVMLRKIGVGSLDELIDKTIPANIRKNYHLDKLPRGKQRGMNLPATLPSWQAKTSCSRPISAWGGTTQSLRQSSNATSSKTPSGILPILLTRQKFRKADWKL
mgnify:CR=1 FL=1